MMVQIFIICYKKFRKKKIVVRSEEEFTNAVHSKYGAIQVEGSLKEKMITKYHSTKRNNIIWGIVGLVGVVVFWPLCIAGIIGNLSTSDMTDYKMSDKNGTIVFYHKKCKVAK